MKGVIAFAILFLLSVALIWWLASWYMAAGWALFLLTGLLVWVVSRDDRERRRAEEMELLERALRIEDDPWHSLPARCHEAPDPYSDRRAA